MAQTDLPSSPDSPSLWANSELVEQAFTRAAGAPLIKGNAVRLLKDGQANYPAWFEAIRAARKRVTFALGEPGRSSARHVFRTDQLIASAARHSLWPPNGGARASTPNER